MIYMVNLLYLNSDNIDYRNSCNNLFAYCVYSFSLLSYYERRNDVSKRKKIKSRKKDRRIFSRTAEKSKTVNNSPPLFRGGIRL